MSTPTTSTSASRDRDGQSPGADPQLEHAWPPVARRRAGQLDDDVGADLGVADAGVPLVVDVGERGAVGPRGVALHAAVLHPSATLAARTVSVAAVDRLIYLDHAATTPMREDAVAAMLPFLTERFANPCGSHRFARDARRAVDEARDVVAAVIGCRPGEVVFTGGGTEADNAAITGAVAPARRTGRVPGHRAPRRAARRRARRRHGRRASTPPVASTSTRSTRRSATTWRSSA